jgi:thiopurine S-methyltransferase
MDAGFWLERWKRSEIGFHQSEINPHLQEYWDRLEVPAGGRVFVPLCGKSRDMLWLRAQGHGVLGVEISPIALRDFFSESGLAPSTRSQGRFERWEADGLVILRGDFFDLDRAALGDVAGVYDRASLVALPPPMRVRYAEQLEAILPDAVATLLVTVEYPQHQMNGPPFSVTEDEVRRLYERRYEVTPLFAKDVLQESPRFAERGLTRLVERVYRLQPRQIRPGDWTRSS